MAEKGRTSHSWEAGGGLVCELVDTFIQTDTSDFGGMGVGWFCFSLTAVAGKKVSTAVRFQGCLETLILEYQEATLPPLVVSQASPQAHQWLAVYLRAESRVPVGVPKHPFLSQKTQVFRWKVQK